MGNLIRTFTFDRNTFRRNEEESANSVVDHIERVRAGRELDKTASNIVGALASYMGVFRRENGRPVSTELANVFLRLYARNKSDSWRWLVARSLWLFVVPNGTACKVNEPAKDQSTRFGFFQLLLQLLTLLSVNSGKYRFLYFEELCRLFDEDSNWKLSGKELFDRLLVLRSGAKNVFGSNRSFLADLENSLDAVSEFDIPRDNFSGLFLKAFAQTGFFDFLTAPNGKTVAIALGSNLDFVVQRRIRFILDNPPAWNGVDWSGYLDLKDEDFPEEVATSVSASSLESSEISKDLKQLLGFANECFAAANLKMGNDYVLRFATSLLSKRFLILTGLAGSGKTKLAQGFARWMVPACGSVDVFRQGAKIPSERTVYYVGKCDSLSVEFWNSEDEAQATKVVIAREMIEEWANYIRNNSIGDTVTARAIREGVKIGSKFSDQLHGFETHLKAAAFAFLEGARNIENNRNCYEVLPVGADWTGNENILGYPDGLQVTRYISKPALELILQAADNPTHPYFLILDEMNLSHVERYFSDILSSIESGEGLELYSAEMDKPEAWRKTSSGKAVPPKISQLPKNLFIIGTVNVDETTYMFSPKVLDRANVIEFRMNSDDLSEFISSPAKSDLTIVDGKGAKFGAAFVAASTSSVSVPDDVKADFESELMLFFGALQFHGMEFGYRTAYESARFVHFYKFIGSRSDEDIAWVRNALDCVILQKLLPKLHGSRGKLGPALKKLWFLCACDYSSRGPEISKSLELVVRSSEQRFEPSVLVPIGAPYPLSAEKIGRMWRLLVENGFTSFAEA